MIFSVNSPNHDAISCASSRSCRSSSVFAQSGSWFVKINWSHRLLKEGILGVFHKWSNLPLNQSKRKIPLMEHWCNQKDRKFILSLLFIAFQEHFIFIQGMQHVKSQQKNQKWMLILTSFHLVITNGVTTASWSVSMKWHGTDTICASVTGIVSTTLVNCIISVPHVPANGVAIYLLNFLLFFSCI